MFKFLKSIVLVIALIVPSQAFASDGGAQWREFGPFFNSSGTIYTGIKIDVYTVGTTTNKTYWTDEGKVTAGAHPLVDSDTDGIVGAFFDGDYRFRVKDSTGAVLDVPIDWDNVRVTSDTATMWEGNAGTSFPSCSSANAWQLAVKHTAGNTFQDIAVCDTTSFQSLFLDSFHMKNYADFCTAISTIGATVGVLTIDDPEVEAIGCTVPTTLILNFIDDGRLDPNASITVTINSSAKNWPLRRIFGGSGTVVFGAGATEAVYVEWFGENTTPGTTDMYSALRAAYVAAKGGVVQLLPTIYGIGTMLDMDGDGGYIQGVTSSTNLTQGGTIKVLGAINAIRMSVQFNIGVRNLYIEGNSVGLNGIIAKNAGQGNITSVMIKNFTQDGVLIDTAHGGAGGNNNQLKISHVVSVLNNRGIAVPTPQLDNNAIEYDMVNLSNNTSHGLLHKGQNSRVWGGIFEGNGGYGIQISEASDISTSVGNIIVSPWLESNTLGGYRGGGKSGSNLLIIDGQQQRLTNAAGSFDIELSSVESGSAGFRFSGGLATLRVGAGTSSALLEAGGESGTPDSDLVFRATGTGTIQADDHFQKKTTANLTASTTQTQGQGLITVDNNHYSTVANTNDTATLPVAKVGMEIFISNKGANTMQIFPNTGATLGAGTDTATTLAAGSNVTFLAIGTLTWIVK